MKAIRYCLERKQAPVNIFISLVSPFFVVTFRFYDWIYCGEENKERNAMKAPKQALVSFLQIIFFWLKHLKESGLRITSWLN